MPKIIINTFGEGIEIRQIQLDAERYQKWSAIALKKKRELADLLLDPFFYHQLRDNRVGSLLDLEAKVLSGVLDKPKSHIEIWFNRRKVLKIKPNDVFNEMLLFPLFQIDRKPNFNLNELESGIYIIQKTFGLLSKVELKIEDQNLDLDDFGFSISAFKKEQFLKEIKYQNQNFNLVKSETVITYQTGFEII